MQYFSGNVNPFPPMVRLSRLREEFARLFATLEELRIHRCHELEYRYQKPFPTLEPSLCRDCTRMLSEMILRIYPVANPRCHERHAEIMEQALAAYAGGDAETLSVLLLETEQLTAAEREITAVDVALLKSEIVKLRAETEILLESERKR